MNFDIVKLWVNYVVLGLGLYVLPPLTQKGTTFIDCELIVINKKSSRPIRPIDSL